MSLHSCEAGGLAFTVDSKGAQLMSLRKDGREYLWQGDPTWWPRRAPVLFPIVGNIRDDRAHSQRGEVRLGRHGPATTRESFPYDFELDMTYAAADGRLTQTFAVTNAGDADLPFVLGGHPAFNVPVAADEGESFSDYRLEFSQPWTYASPRIDTSTGLLNFQDRFQLLEDADTLALTHRSCSRTCPAAPCGSSAPPATACRSTSTASTTWASGPPQTTRRSWRSSPGPAAPPRPTRTTSSSTSAA